MNPSLEEESKSSVKSAAHYRPSGQHAAISQALVQFLPCSCERALIGPPMKMRRVGGEPVAFHYCGSSGLNNSVLLRRIRVLLLRRIHVFSAKEDLVSCI